MVTWPPAFRLLMALLVALWLPVCCCRAGLADARPVSKAQGCCRGSLPEGGGQCQRITERRDEPAGPCRDHGGAGCRCSKLVSTTPQAGPVGTFPAPLARSGVLSLEGPSPAPPPPALHFRHCFLAGMRHTLRGARTNEDQTLRAPRTARWGSVWGAKRAANSEAHRRGAPHVAAPNQSSFPDSSSHRDLNSRRDCLAVRDTGIVRMRNIRAPNTDRDAAPGAGRDGPGRNGGHPPRRHHEGHRSH
jgi:hypothetical protein